MVFRRIYFLPLLMWAAVFITYTARGQEPESVIRAYLMTHQQELKLADPDIKDWTISSSSTDDQDVTYVYIQQRAHGLSVFGAVANFAIRNGAVLAFGDRLKRDVLSEVRPPVPSIGAVEAIRTAALDLGIGPISPVILRVVSEFEFELVDPAISGGMISAKLLYQPTAHGDLRAAWDFTIQGLSTTDRWHVAVDASTGAMLRKYNYTLSCAPSGYGEAAGFELLDHTELPYAPMLPLPPDGAGYRVFPYPVESPAVGAQVTVFDPADPEASPNGWHDMDGQPGAEYTITRGTNVNAQMVIGGNVANGYSPDGGAELNFNGAYVETAEVLDNRDASITNLFYACNVLHDVLYHYGFDHDAGNFQHVDAVGGFGNDPLGAWALDDFGVNNAQISVGPDGESPLMKMFAWRAIGDSTLLINAPTTIAGAYGSILAAFGPVLSLTPITATVTLVQDDDGVGSAGCAGILNAPDINGAIALMDRGACFFDQKVMAMQELGAIAVIVVNNIADDPISMPAVGGMGFNITIPSVMVTMATGDMIKQALLSTEVIASIQSDGSRYLRDSGFDNGIIAHEYGHGLSVRLTGGPMDADCLQNAEQPGEGWSDWLGLMMTMGPADTGGEARGYATYVRRQGSNGPGIRPSPYSTDFAVNSYTYGATNDGQLSEPHGVGFVWATMLWDLTWALIDEEGFDADMYHGTGGNNTAMHLVLDAMKLQPCSPGFVDARNAILVADVIRYGGAHVCLIWNSFAQRGMGYSADQGSSSSRFDQVEAFDPPPFCLSVGLDDQPTVSDLQLMPNPATGEVFVTRSSANLEAGTIRILGVEGRVVRTALIPAGVSRITLDLSGLASSLYTVELTAGQRVFKERLVVH